MMTTEQKQILLQDLCGRLPYGVIGLYTWKNKKSYNRELTGCLYDELKSSWNSTEDSQFSPYLRPMSSMTEEEYKDLEERFCWNFADIFDKNRFSIEIGYSVDIDEVQEFIDWLNQHHFDYRGLIEKGLALEAPEGMYNNKI